MTKEQIRAKWEQRHADYTHSRAIVDGSILTKDFLDDLDIATRAQEDEVLTIKQAAEVSGYSHGHLARLIRGNKLPNAGRPNAPRLRRGDLPIKPRHGLTAAGDIGKLSKAQIVQSVVNQKRQNDGEYK